jgi:putative transposase
MLKLMRPIVSGVVRRFRRRAVLELENLALRHQLHVLRRQRPGRLRLFAIDRLLWTWLYRLWPGCLDTMVLVKPATVVKWHRQGFRRFWRWRSRSGRPSVDREIRKLIREMSSANPLWGTPRLHGELLKLGIEISQATVAKYMVRRRGRTFSELAQLSAQSGGRDRCDRYVHCGVRIVSAALCTDHPGPRSQEDCAI